MDLSINKIVITEKGRDIQSRLLSESSDFQDLPTAKSFTKEYFQDLPNCSQYAVREGYFRPKKPTDLISSKASSNHLYPNYLKRDPREYPSKHQCVWDPRPIVQSKKKVPSAYPITKEIHHTLFKSQSGDLSGSLTALESNFILNGLHGNNGHVAMNLTTCNYPDYKSKLPVERLKSVTKLSSPMIKSVTNGWFFDQRSSSEASVLQYSPTKTSNSFKLGLERFENHSGIKSGALSHRITTNSMSRLMTTDISNNSLGNKTFLRTIKTPEEKIEQILRKFEAKEKDYQNILEKQDRKTKERLQQKLENPDYLYDFGKKLHQATELFNSVKTDTEKEDLRVKKKLKDLGKIKYGKTWEKSEKLLRKKNPQKNPKVVPKDQKYSIMPPSTIYKPFEEVSISGESDRTPKRPTTSRFTTKNDF